MNEEEVMALAFNNGLNIKYLSEEEINTRTFNQEKEEYSISDCIMVRTTDVFPHGGKVQTPDHGNAQVPARSEIFGETIRSIIRSKYSEVMSEEEEKNFFSELRKYEILFDVSRSTVHFTMNGLVSSHLYGNFSGRPYIILEPFDEHCDSESLVGLRVEDTYFNDDVELSERVVIMMNKDSFISTINDPDCVEELRGLNVVVFEGDELCAVEHILHSMGYNSFEINNHGYVKGLNSNTEDSKMYMFIRQVASNLGVSQERHFYSSFREKDFYRALERDEQRNKDFLYYVLDNTILSDGLKESLLKEAQLNESRDMSQSPNVKAFINEVGLDNMKCLVQSYNEKIKEDIKTKNSNNQK